MRSIRSTPIGGRPLPVPYAALGHHRAGQAETIKLHHLMILDETVKLACGRSYRARPGGSDDRGGPTGGRPPLSPTPSGVARDAGLAEHSARLHCQSRGLPIPISRKRSRPMGRRPSRRWPSPAGLARTGQASGEVLPRTLLHLNVLGGHPERPPPAPPPDRPRGAPGPPGPARLALASPRLLR